MGCTTSKNVDAPIKKDPNQGKEPEKQQKSLYERLGGEPAIQAVVDGMYAKIFPDPELEDFFRKTDQENQKQMQKKFLTFATGGPSEYDGKSMHDAHKGRGIEEKDFMKVCQHVIATMEELKVPAELIEEVKALLLPLKDHVCS